MTSPKIRQFFFTIHKANEAEKLQAVAYCETLKPLWYMVALEPYTEKEGNHIHMMFQLKNPRSANNVTHEVMSQFSRERSDVHQSQGKGRFSDNENYLKDPHAGEHKKIPKICDPQPVIWPEVYTEESITKKTSDADVVIEMIRNGSTIHEILRLYPKYVLNNLSKIEKFMHAAKSAGFIRLKELPRHARVSAPWE